MSSSPSLATEDSVTSKRSSIGLQMVCNADCVISNVVAKWPGSVHDSRIFRASEIYQCLSQGEFSGVLLGDRGCGCQPFLLTPSQTPGMSGSTVFLLDHQHKHQTMLIQ
ncbi:putative nuclease HARBI1 [Oncorhynchus keta]|uniref:putative nuclease HARBI1 n=1 Tax=Oncorhynchus keta TaxID=8018 RepID=UPI00227B690B|nr:putative nuclease HARBI1 [Oncorhynchus keta]